MGKIKSIKNGIIYSAGAASIAKKKIEGALGSLIERGGIKKQDIGSAVNKIVNIIDVQTKGIRNAAQIEIKRVAEKTASASLKEAERLKNKIGKLEKMLRSEGQKTIRKAKPFARKAVRRAGSAIKQAIKRRIW